MKILKQITLMTILAPTISFAMAIPKVDLATCQVNKEDIRSFFSIGDTKDEEVFKSVKSPMQITLQQVNLAGQPGIADYYKVNFHAVDKNGKGVRQFQRSLEQVSVNYSGNAISVGYAPYQVDRTYSEPFAMLIEEKNKAGDANGFLNVVPLQSSSADPMKQIKMNCQILKSPSTPIQISKEEILGLNEKDQFEVIYNLYRLGHSSAPVSGSANSKKEKDFSKIGLSDQTIARIKSDISTYLANRPLLPLADYTMTKNPSVVVPEGDHCGALNISSITPVYDSLTARSLRKSKDAELRKKAIGYVISSVSCSLPARIVTTDGYDKGERTEDKNNWQASDVTINSKGLMKTSFKASSVNLRGY